VTEVALLAFVLVMSMLVMPMIILIGYVIIFYVEHAERRRFAAEFRRQLREQSEKKLADDRRYVVESGPYR